MNKKYELDANPETITECLMLCMFPTQEDGEELDMLSQAIEIILESMNIPVKVKVTFNNNIGDQDGAETLHLTGFCHFEAMATAEIPDIPLPAAELLDQMNEWARTRSLNDGKLPTEIKLFIKNLTESQSSSFQIFSAPNEIMSIQELRELVS